MAHFRPFRKLKNKLSEFTDFFSVQFFLLKLVGITFDLQSSRLKLKRVKSINWAVLSFCLTIFVVDVSAAWIYLIFTEAEIEAKTKTAINVLTSFEVLAKMVCLVFNSDKIKSILRKLQKINEIKWSENEYLIKKTNVILVYAKVTIISGALFYLISILSTLNKYFIEGKWVAIYINHLWYPFNDQDMSFYVPVSLFHLCFHVIFMSCYVAIDALILIIIVFINQQYQQIANKFMSPTSLDGAELKNLVDQQCCITRYEMNFFGE